MKMFFRCLGLLYSNLKYKFSSAFLLCSHRSLFRFIQRWTSLSLHLYNPFSVPSVLAAVNIYLYSYSSLGACNVVTIKYPTRTLPTWTRAHISKTMHVWTLNTPQTYDQHESHDSGLEVPCWGLHYPASSLVHARPKLAVIQRQQRLPRHSVASTR